jgi:hypothetical protein
MMICLIMKARKTIPIGESPQKKVEPSSLLFPGGYINATAGEVEIHPRPT